MKEPYCCQSSGESLQNGEPWFYCLQCNKPSKLEYRFDDKPICRSCATRTGLSIMLDYQRDQAHHLIDQVLGNTTHKIDNWLSTKMEAIVRRIIDATPPSEPTLPVGIDDVLRQKMEEVVNRAFDHQALIERYEQQQQNLQTEIEELQAQLNETEQWRQRAERAESELQQHQQRMLTEQEIMELEGFRDNGDGTVTQLGTGLIWMRFSLGQHWVDGRVVGNAEKVNVAEAKKHISILNKREWLGRKNWDLPGQSSLKSLLKRSSSPTVDRIIFPGIVGRDYWTAEDTGPNMQRYVNFKNGNSGSNSKSNNCYVILVSNQ